MPPFIMMSVLFNPTIASTSSRAAQPFPDEAALRCRSGNMALKGNLPEKASLSYRQALSLNPQLWEAFEGLCALGVLAFLANLVQITNITQQDRYLKSMRYSLPDPHLSKEYRQKISRRNLYQSQRVLDSSHQILAMPVISFAPGSPTWDHPNPSEWARPKAVLAILCILIHPYSIPLLFLPHPIQSY